VWQSGGVTSAVNRRNSSSYQQTFDIKRIGLLHFCAVMRTVGVVRIFRRRVRRDIPERGSGVHGDTKTKTFFSKNLRLHFPEKTESHHTGKSLGEIYKAPRSQKTRTTIFAMFPHALRGIPPNTKKCATFHV